MIYLIILICSLIPQTESEFLLDTDVAGFFYPSMPMDEALRIANKHYKVKKSKIELEGHKVDVWNVFDSDELLLQLESRDRDSDSTLWRIWVKSKKYKTKNGIGIGSTMSEVLDEYPLEYVQVEGGLSLKVEGLDIGLMLDGSTVPDSWWTDGMVDSELPRSTKIRLIIVI